jgi:thiol-disulfide isomerase/thioredoxin
LKRISAVLAGLALVGSLAGCAPANDELSQQFREGSNKNYIAGDGSVSEYAADNRVSPTAWAGVTESGVPLTSDMLSGVVTVVNFWYAGCAPCRAEAKDLAKLSGDFAKDRVQFIGVNVRDSAATAQAFDRTFGIEYPSIIDAQSGSVVLAFTGVVSPQAVPTTLVIDKKGRVASRILGRIEVGTLKALIKTVVAEK